MDDLFAMLEIYNEVRKHRVPNLRGARIILHHRLNVEAWERYRGVIADPRVLDYVKYGFPIGYANRFIPTPATENHKSATQHAKHGIWK